MFENVKYCGIGKFISNGEWIHPDRVIDSYEIIFVTKGDVFIDENGTKYHVKMGEAIILQPNLRHRGYQPSENTEFFWMHWYGDIKFSNGVKHQKIENPYNITLYLQLLSESRVTTTFKESLDYLTRLVLIELYSNNKKTLINPIVEKVAAYINANCYRPITEKQIASDFGYNPDYLNRIFKADFLKSIKKYINDKRMEYIKNLILNTDLTLKEIADAAGFTEYKYFLKFFKYHEKITPSEFYKHHAKIHTNSR